MAIPVERRVTNLQQLCVPSGELVGRSLVVRRVTTNLAHVIRVELEALYVRYVLSTSDGKPLLHAVDFTTVTVGRLLNVLYRMHETVG